MKEEWLFHGALVPIDAETTAALVAEIKRLIDVVGGMALAQPEQETVAYFDWLPEEATHIAQIKVKTRSGGRLEMGAYVFKYDNEVLMVYTTDNDNEYPGWREAKQCFYHLNFPVFPIPTTPPKRPWVRLTDAEMQALWDRYAHMEMMRAIEAKLKEKNT
jgi:hypothetical protein